MLYTIHAWPLLVWTTNFFLQIHPYFSVFHCFYMSLVSGQSVAIEQAKGMLLQQSKNAIRKKIQIHQLFSYDSSSTPHPRQWVSQWAIVSDWERSLELASLFMPTSPQNGGKDICFVRLPIINKFWKIGPFYNAIYTTRQRGVSLVLM